jgi:hypothetical protein
MLLVVLFVVAAVVAGLVYHLKRRSDHELRSPDTRCD